MKNRTTLYKNLPVETPVTLSAIAYLRKIVSARGSKESLAILDSLVQELLNRRKSS